MKSFSQARLLRIYTSELDRYLGKPFYEAIVMEARKAGLSGATVLRGGLGYGHDSMIHSGKILDLSLDLPLVIEIVDSEEKIDAFLPRLDEMMQSGIVTIERLQVMRYVKKTRAHAPHKSMMQKFHLTKSPAAACEQISART